MSPSRRWNRDLMHTAFVCLSITATFQGSSQHHHPEAEHEHASQAGEAGEAGHGETGETGRHGFHHDFSDAEHWTDVFDSEERREWQKPEEVVELMAIESGMTIADLGAGTGFFVAYLATAAGPDGRVLALDPEPGMVDFMRQRAERQGWSNVDVRRIPVDDPELEDDSVDRVLIVNTWHHIDSRADYAAQLLRALEPGGSVWVVDFDKDSPSGPPKQHRLPPEQIIEELAAGGLEARQIEEDLPRQFIVVGSKGSGGG